jgi:hypothetical protein
VLATALRWLKKTGYTDDDFGDDYPLIVGAYEYYLDHLQTYQEVFPVNKEKIKELAENMLSAYQLLPSSTYIQNVSEYIKIIGPPSYSADYDQSLSHLKNIQSLNSTLIAEAEDFHDQQLEFLSFQNIDVYNIIACNSKTYVSYSLDATTGEKLLSGWGGGDTTIPYQSADFVMTTDDNKFYLSDNTLKHFNLASEKDVREAVVEILMETGTSERADLDSNTANCGLTGDSLTWESPVDIHIYDSEGNHTGPNEKGGIERQIPEIGYEIIGHHKFVFLPDGDKEYEIVAIGTDIGTYDLTIERYESDAVNESTVFNDVPVIVGTRSTFNKRQNLIDKQVNVRNNAKEVTYHPFSELRSDEVKDYNGPSVELRAVSREVGRTKIHLSGRDDQSGISNIYYSLNNSEFTEYKNPIDVSSLDDVSIKYYAVDRAGNNSETKESLYTQGSYTKLKKVNYEQKEYNEVVE